jgi:15-cis-phytoene desaturase
VVVGAGLAGLSCAYRVAADGREALVLESSRILGGRTASWEEDGMQVESGLHRMLGIYRELPGLLQEAGLSTDAIVDWVDEVGFLVPDGGPRAVFGAAPYHKPLQTIFRALANNDFLPPRDKAALAVMGARGLRDCARSPLELDEHNIADYARQHGVSETTITRLLQAMTAGVLFMPAEQFSAYPVFAPILEGVRNLLTFRVGAFKGGMSEVMIHPIAAAIEARGGRICTQAEVTRLVVEGEAVRGVILSGEQIRARHVVLAVPLVAAQKLIREAFGEHSWFQPMLQLPTLPAATIQMELDRPAMPNDLAHFTTGTALACFAEQSRTTFRHLAGRLSVILYPPEEFLHLDPPAILARVEADALRLGIDLRGRVKRYRVVRHDHDFYALRPGTERLRPSQATPIDGLSLAGDYTRQPFVASMEGAVLSGRYAADAALGKVRRVPIRQKI